MFHARPDLGGFVSILTSHSEGCSVLHFQDPHAPRTARDAVQMSRAEFEAMKHPNQRAAREERARQEARAPR